MRQAIAYFCCVVLHYVGIYSRTSLSELIGTAPISETAKLCTLGNGNRYYLYNIYHAHKYYIRIDKYIFNMFKHTTKTLFDIIRYLYL